MAEETKGSEGVELQASPDPTKEVSKDFVVLLESSSADARAKASVCCVCSAGTARCVARRWLTFVCTVRVSTGWRPDRCPGVAAGSGKEDSRGAWLRRQALGWTHGRERVYDTPSPSPLTMTVWCCACRVATRLPLPAS